MQDVPVPQGDLSAARASMVILRASAALRRDEPGLQTKFAGEERALGEAEVLERLEGLPKPVSCSSSREGRTLTVECLPTPLASLETTRQVLSRRVLALGGSIRTLARQDSLEPRILFRGPDESMLLSVSTFETWLSSYLFSDYSLSVLPPDTLALELGACAIVLAGAGLKTPDVPGQ